MDVASTLPNTDTHVWIKFHMDLEDWNFTFRSAMQFYLALVLCYIFGVWHFAFLSHIFTDGFLFSANSYTPPGMKGKITCWNNHAGGNQGILQKLWTLITIVVIRGVMHRLDLEHRLIGSGDNQVLFVKMERGETLRARIDRIKDELRVAFENVGLSLKFSETWASSALLCYQRQYYLNEVMVPGGIKLAARAFAGEGDISCGLNSIVTTAMNGGMGLTNLSSDPLIGPAFSLIEVLTNLLFDPRYEDCVPREQKRLVMLTFLSSDFGFLPMQQLSGFLYAGHQDTLSESLALLRYVWDRYPDYHRLITGAVDFRVGKHDRESKLQLILEPTSLNISRPRLPESLIRTKVEDYLTDRTSVKNVQLKAMFTGCKKEDQLVLSDQLMQIRPINTSLCNTLFEYSPPG